MIKFYISILFILCGLVSLYLSNQGYDLILVLTKESRIKIDYIERDVIKTCPVTQDKIYICSCGTTYTKDGYDYMLSTNNKCSNCNSS